MSLASFWQGGSPWWGRRILVPIQPRRCHFPKNECKAASTDFNPGTGHGVDPNVEQHLRE